LTIEVREPSPRPACIPPCYVRLAARELKGTGVKVATVVSFPFGNDTTAVKVAAVGMRSWAAPPRASRLGASSGVAIMKEAKDGDV